MREKDKDVDLYIPTDELAAYGENLGKSTLLPGSIGSSKIAREIMSCLREIKAAHKKAAAYAAENKKIPQVMEWLLDNWYIAEREGKEACLHLKDAGNLRKTGNGGALVMQVAAAIVRSGRGKVSPDRIHVFAEGFQKAKTLNEKEISLLVPVLKGALIGSLKELCEKVFDPDSEEKINLYMGNIFSSLRLLSNLDLSDILEEISPTEKILKQDPAGAYEKMEEKARQNYRREISRLARRNRIEEYEVAEKVLELARSGRGRERHVGYHIFNKPLGIDGKKRDGGVYIGGIVLATSFFTILLGILLENIAVTLLLFIPISEIIKNTVDFFVIKFVEPRPVHRMKLKNGVPAEGKTVCVISALISGPESGKNYGELLEEYRLANRDAGENLIFGILGDFPESASEEIEGCDEWLQNIRAEIEGLNKKYGGGFVLLIRNRTYNPRDKKYMGWERKRGAILELVRLLRGKDSTLRCEAGNKLMLEGVRYIITLDSDTRLNVGSAKEMIGAMLHPLNTPVINRKKGIVTEGAGLMQPRISVELKAANRSDLTRIYAGQGGVDPYGSASSDVYQDLFGEGSFTGKGIIDAEAFEACLENTLPQNTILSHDLLEGAYLHASYLGDVELTDGYPYKVLSYFARMHRWTRGDWQLTPWLFAKVENGSGEKVRNPLNQISRWKIFDNLRRSMAPVFTMAALLTGMLVPGVGVLWAATVAILSVLSRLLLSSGELMFRRDPGTKARYHSTIISGFAAGLLETLSHLILLPYHAYICLHGALTAIYRMLISKKNMLAWVTASDMERKIGSSGAYYYWKMLPEVIIALVVIFFSRYVSAIALGIVWLLGPLYAKSLSHERVEKVKISEEHRMYLSRAAGDIWRYFEDFLTPEDHFLPPDNWQEQPATGVAHRTSPTNIGLALAAAQSASDLNLCHPTKALGYIENMLATVERMKKWNGHLYNWYDTKTLKPLHPVYVSSVDSGNFAGCLIALREGLLELGEKELARRANALYEAMDFSVLMDSKRKLFYIGWDLERDLPTEGWYDLMASEARQTSYIAIARGDVTSRHWRKLSRSLVSQDNFSGMASWTGTMFEYLMPNLLIPFYKNSLMYESLKFCLYVQKRHHTPWGISESAFYSFDPALNYSYKAHGVQRLALRRGLNKEVVVSPYSTFLALPLDIKGGINNLRKIERMGAVGRYGFYEAVDFTPNRQSGESHEIVRTFMAHHLGMSLVSLNNVLGDNVMQKRFMRDRSMAAYSELLQEKVPVGQVILRQPPREIPEKPRREAGSGWSRELSGTDIMNPACSVLSNGTYSVLMTEAGASRSMIGQTMVTKFEPKQLHGAIGIGFFLKNGSELIGLQPAPYFDRDTEFRTHQSGAAFRIFARKGGLESLLETSVPSDELGEIRKVTLKNTADSSMPCELFVYLEPVLAPPEDYFAHPAFSKLGIETELTEDTIVIKRRKSGEREELYAAFSSSETIEFDTSREKALGRSGFEAAASRPPTGSMGTVLDPCVMARVRLNLKPHESRQVSFALAIGSKGSDAVLSSRRIMGMPISGSPSYLDTAAAKLGLTGVSVESAMEKVTDLIFLTESRRKQEEYIAVASGQRGLWPFGISGDLPVLSIKLDSESRLKEAALLIREHNFLSRMGVKFDLVLLIHDGGDYRQPIRFRLNEQIAELGIQSFMGARGGIHIIDGAKDVSEILAASVRVITPGERYENTRRTDYPHIATRKTEVSDGRLKFYYDKTGNFVFRTGGELPANTWSHILANRRFGYIPTDCGTGHMWHLNARENKITPWINDSLEVRGPERISLLRDGEEISLFAAADGYPQKVTYGFGMSTWEKNVDGTEIIMTAFVPPDVSCRIILIEGDFRPEDRIAYFAELILGADTRNTAYVTTKYKDGIFSAKNGGNREFPDDTFAVMSSSPDIGHTCDKKSYLLGEMDGRAGAGLDPCIGAIYPAALKMVIVAGCDDMEKMREYLSPERATAALWETEKYWRGLTHKVTVQTPNDSLNRYLNGWAQYQTLASRIWGRSSMYQSGGAYGFRDQLQDVCALISQMPQEAERHILRASEHQFEEGDVQHWWHPSGVEGIPDKGVRTRCSDDLLWLPYTLLEYVEKTGNMELLDAKAGYIKSEPLSPSEQERYDAPEKSDITESVFLHAVRAIDMALERGRGEHGLTLVGTGDWNDGMNLVGAKGKGESVWLTWFLCHILERFGKLCDRRGETELSERYAAESAKYAEAANNAWDGEWFLRGYYDSGDTLGSRGDEECRIDSIAQSFGALCEGADMEKVKTGLKSAVSYLFDRENKVVKLFTPPFGDGERDPGYIRGYAPGLRENGGQYTHAAVWLAMGCLGAGMTTEGYEILNALLPEKKPREIYRVEPYVIAADVYANPGHAGRGGWSWYTGAAGWYYRVAMENLLGIRVIDGRLYIKPSLPPKWNGYTMTWKNGDREYQIEVRSRKEYEIFVDGKPYDGTGIDLKN